MFSTGSDLSEANILATIILLHPHNQQKIEKIAALIVKRNLIIELYEQAKSFLNNYIAEPCLKCKYTEFVGIKRSSEKNNR